MRSMTGDYQSTWWRRPRSCSVTLRPSATSLPPLEHRDQFSAVWPCPHHAVSSELTRLRLVGAGDFPCQVRVPQLALAVQTRAHSPARPELSPSAPRTSDRAGAG